MAEDNEEDSTIQETVGLLSFLYKESEDNYDIDIVNLQYYLTEKFPNRKFLREKEYSEFSPKERMSLLVDLMNEALCTNKLREFVKELATPSNHKKENDIRKSTKYVSR